MAEVAWRYARQADVSVFATQYPTLRAVVITVDGEPAGLIGLAAEGAKSWLFSECKALLVPHLKRLAVCRALMAAMAWVRASRVPVCAASSNDPLMKRLGFVHHNEDVYVWSC